MKFNKLLLILFSCSVWAPGAGIHEKKSIASQEKLEQSESVKVPEVGAPCCQEEVVSLSSEQVKGMAFLDEISEMIVSDEDSFKQKFMFISANLELQNVYKIFLSDLATLQKGILGLKNEGKVDSQPVSKSEKNMLIVLNIFTLRNLLISVNHLLTTCLEKFLQLEIDNKESLLSKIRIEEFFNYFVDNIFTPNLESIKTEYFEVEQKNLVKRLSSEVEVIPDQIVPIYLIENEGRKLPVLFDDARKMTNSNIVYYFSVPSFFSTKNLIGSGAIFKENELMKRRGVLISTENREIIDPKKGNFTDLFHSIIVYNGLQKSKSFGTFEIFLPHSIFEQLFGQWPENALLAKIVNLQLGNSEFLALSNLQWDDFLCLFDCIFKEFCVDFTDLKDFYTKFILIANWLEDKHRKITDKESVALKQAEMLYNFARFGIDEDRGTPNLKSPKSHSQLNLARMSEEIVETPISKTPKILSANSRPNTASPVSKTSRLYTASSDTPNKRKKRRHGKNFVFDMANMMGRGCSPNVQNSEAFATFSQEKFQLAFSEGVEVKAVELAKNNPKLDSTMVADFHISPNSKIHENDRLSVCFDLSLKDLLFYYEKTLFDCQESELNVQKDFVLKFINYWAKNSHLTFSDLEQCKFLKEIMTKYIQNQMKNRESPKSRKISFSKEV